MTNLSKKGLIIVFILSLHSILAAKPISNEEWEKLKQTALERKRLVMYNNDGCDIYFPVSVKKASAENFLKQRLAPQVGSKVNTIIYNPGTLDWLTTRSKVAEHHLKVIDSKRKSIWNITGALHKQNTDPMLITQQFCRKNNFEFFVSLRMNDQHDQAHRPNKPYFRWTKFKENHPQYLFGNLANQPQYAFWSGLDYNHAEVRKRALAVIKELISNYEVDGLELDFGRDLQIFGSVARGALSASSREINIMTGFMRNVRKLCDEVGRKRGRPILIAVRLADSAAYSKAVGLDIVQWMKEKLIDIYVGGFYFQLNPWRKSVELAHKYGVKFYAGISLMRLDDVAPGFERGGLSPAARIGREATALQAGVDGIHYFNYDYVRVGKYENMFGSLDDIRFKDKRYFITSYIYPDRFPDTHLNNGERFNNMRSISRFTPLKLLPGEKTEFKLEVGDDFSHPALKDKKFTLKLALETAKKSGGNLTVTLNGHTLKRTESTDSLTVFDVSPTNVKFGENDITLSAASGSGKLDTKIILTGAKRPKAPWRHLFKTHDFRNSEKIVGDALQINDNGSKPKEMANIIYPLYSVPGSKLHLQFTTKVEYSTNDLAVCVRMADGKNVEILTLGNNSIGLFYAGKKADFVPEGEFHNYDVQMKDGVVTVKVDNQELLRGKTPVKTRDQAGKLKDFIHQTYHMHQQSLLFGSLSGQGTGSALWKNIRLLDDGKATVIKDLKLELNFDNYSHLHAIDRQVKKWDFVLDASTDLSNGNRLFKNTYSAELLALVDNPEKKNKVLCFKNTKGYELIRVTDEKLLKSDSGIYILKMKFKPLAAKPRKAVFSLGIRVTGKNNERVSCNARIFPDKIMMPWGNVRLDKNYLGKWLTVTIIVDINNKISILKINDKEISHGGISVDKSSAPLGIIIGDTSSEVDGICMLEYMKFKK